MEIILYLSKLAFKIVNRGFLIKTFSVAIFSIIVVLWVLTPFCYVSRKNATRILVTGTVLLVPLGLNHGKTVLH